MSVISRWSLAMALLFLALVSLGKPLPTEKPLPQEQLIPTLETSLQLLAQLPAHQAPQLAVSLDLELREDRVTVVVQADHLSPAQLAPLEAELKHSAPTLGLWEVELPRSALLPLARLPGVRFVRRPFTPYPLTTSQGVALIGAPAWHTAGLTGAGVRVAVIDLEFGGLSAAIAAGEVRNVIATIDYTGTGMETGGPHGAACAEIVSEVAPDAQLILMKIDTEVQLQLAVTEALARGANVITHSVGWFNTNFYDGTGVICDIVRTATRGGALWVNSAGNSGGGSHWEGPWRDSDGDGYLDFAPGDETNEFYLDAGTPFACWLTWDAWPVTDQDYDLLLVDTSTMTVVASSANYQSGTQPPAEAIYFTPTASGTYALVIEAWNAPLAPDLELFCSPNLLSLEHWTAASSITAPGNAAESFTVGAIPWTDWTPGTLAPYSSRGPTNDGRTKPDLCAPDTVDTLSYGPSGFPGTSAAAPHVAGAAALALEANPSWGPAQLRSWLTTAAVDLGFPGPDNTYGAGKLNLPAPAPSPGLGSSHTYGPVAGWYMVSLPTPGTAADFGATLWRWNPATGRYEQPPTVEPGKGYWAYLPANTTVTATGTVPTSDIVVDISTAGWHQISSPWPYPKSEIRVLQGGVEKTWAEAVAAGWIQDSIYGYRASDGHYTTPTTLDPWYGYWLRAKVPGLRLRLEAPAS